MVSDHLTDFFNYLSIEKGLSSNTTAAYRRDLERFFHYLSINQLNLSQITPEELVGYISWLRGRANAEFKIGESSIARNVISLRSYFSYLAKEHNYQNPTLILEISGDDLISLRDRALLELLYATGARVTEIINLNTTDISSTQNDDSQVTTIRVKGKGGKERVVPIGSFGLTAVNDYLTRSRPSLCRVLTQKALFLNQRGGRLTRQSAWGIVANRAARAGLAEVVTPHSMRHSFATHLLDGGADIRVVQELLGHASVTTTQIYTLITIDRLRESYASAHPRSK
ncbi:MAG: site-specific tyrosine recombinase XerD [Actinobacteria bacterium]|nr:site-specific tyrosine recombinase XerD [Actinomycetota bacterium]